MGDGVDRAMPMPDEVAITEMFKTLTPAQRQTILAHARGLVRKNAKSFREERRVVPSAVQFASKLRKNSSKTTSQPTSQDPVPAWAIDGRGKKSQSPSPDPATSSTESAKREKTVTCSRCWTRIHESEFDRHWYSRCPKRRARAENPQGERANISNKVVPQNTSEKGKRKKKKKFRPWLVQGGLCSPR
jgi:hypothetical protein